jgi:hypothetical protein
MFVIWFIQESPAGSNGENLSFSGIGENRLTTSLNLSPSRLSLSIKSSTKQSMHGRCFSSNASVS